MPFSVFHISGYMAQFCEQKTQTHAECLIHCYTSNSLAVLELQFWHQSCDSSWTHTSAFNMFLQFADLSANWKRHQSRSLSLSLLTLHFFLLPFSFVLSRPLSLFSLPALFNRSLGKFISSQFKWNFVNFLWRLCIEYTPRSTRV